MIQLSAAVIGIFVALATFHALKKWETRASIDERLIPIGEIQSVTGEVERRLAGSVNIEPVPSSRTLYSQDMVITQKASTSVLELSPIGMVLRINENSRFIPEQDLSREGSMIGTLLSGSVTVLNPGKAGQFRLFRDGHEIVLNSGAGEPLPILPISQNGKPQASEENSNGLIISATHADENAPTSTAAAPTNSTITATTAPESDPGSTSEILTNDDIVHQMRMETGLFQRCYLNYLHRAQNTDPAAGKVPTVSKAAKISGRIVVSFVVQSSGKVNEAKIVRTDFQDAVLQNCVTEVIQRTVYRGFTGSPVAVTEFPISLQ